MKKTTSSHNRARVLAVSLAAMFAVKSINAFAESEEPAPPPKAENKQDNKSDNKPAEKADAAKPKVETQKVDKIEVTGSAYDARQQDTATKIVVTSEEIKKYGDTQLADVLKRVPGVTVTGNNDIRMRGLGNGYTQILVDGERPPPGFSLENLSPTLVERIEIIRAATAEFSTQAVAGTINIVLKKKVNFTQRDLRIGWASGTGYKAPNMGFTFADSAGKLAYSVGGWINQSRTSFPYRGEESTFDARGVQTLLRLSQSESEGKSLFGGLYSRLVWTFGGGDSLTLQSNFFTGTYDNRYNYKSTFVIGAPTSFAIGNGTFDGNNTSISNNFNWIMKVGEAGKLDVKLNTSLNRRENDSAVKAFDLSGNQTQDRVNLSPTNESSLGFTGKYSTPIIEGHAFVSGWDGSVNTTKQTSDLRETAVNAAPIATVDEFRARVQRFAVFAQDEWNLTTDWSLYLGLRWEGVGTESSGNTFARATNRSSVYSPIVQTLWKFPDKSGRQLRFALTRTYKAPNTSNLIPRVFRTQINTPTSPDNGGNPNLKPELATGIDLAYEHFWSQGATMSLSVSARRLTDFNTRATVLIGDRWVNLPINNGNATTRSIEFDAKFPVQSVYKAAPPIDFRFNMARNFSKVDEVPGPNNRLDQQVPFNATVGFDYRVKGGEFVGGSSYTFRSVGEVRTSVTQTRYQTAKRDVEAYVLWKYTPKTQFRLTLANILRQDTVAANTFRDANGASVQSSVTPSALNVRANIELKF
jgi:outer membrane receptor for ferrienterochelin and colicins